MSPATAVLAHPLAAAKMPHASGTVPVLAVAIFHEAAVPISTGRQELASHFVTEVSFMR